MARPTVGGLWAATDAVVRRHFGAFATLSAATVFLPAAVMRLFAPVSAQLPAFDLNTPPPSYSPGLWLGVGAILLFQLAAIVAIAAITADPEEGGGRPLGKVLAGSAQALLRLIGALLLFFIAYVVGAFVLALVGGILGAIAGIIFSTTAKLSQQDLQNTTIVVAAVIVVIIVPLLCWILARLSPLTGVYLREQPGVVAGIRRAWSLSRGSTGAIIGLTLLLWLASLVVALVPLGARMAGVGNLVGIAAGLIGAAAGALYIVYFAAFTGIVYRQLAAPGEA